MADSDCVLCQHLIELATKTVVVKNFPQIYKYRVCHRVSCIYQVFYLQDENEKWMTDRLQSLTKGDNKRAIPCKKTVQIIKKSDRLKHTAI